MNRCLWTCVFLLCGQVAYAQENIDTGVSLETTPQATTTEQAPEMERLLSYQSVMYSDEELQELKNVIDAIKNNEPLPGVEVEVPIMLSNGAIPSRYYYFPQFYLKSVAYYSPNDWVLWINSDKITSSKPNVIDRLTVTHVSPNQVEFTYAFKPEDRSDFSIKPEDERISLNVFDRKASFMLNQNQTFSSYNWKIYEGKVAKAKQDNNAQTTPVGLPSVSEVFQEQLNPAPPGAQAMPEVVKPKGKIGNRGILNNYNDLKIINP